MLERPGIPSIDTFGNRSGVVARFEARGISDGAVDWFRERDCYFKSNGLGTFSRNICDKEVVRTLAQWIEPLLSGMFVIRPVPSRL